MQTKRDNHAECRSIAGLANAREEDRLTVRTYLAQKVVVCEDRGSSFLGVQIENFTRDSKIMPGGGMHKEVVTFKCEHNPDFSRCVILLKTQISIISVLLKLKDRTSLCMCTPL